MIGFDVASVCKTLSKVMFRVCCFGGGLLEFWSRSVISSACCWGWGSFGSVLFSTLVRRLLIMLYENRVFFLLGFVCSMQ